MGSMYFISVLVLCETINIVFSEGTEKAENDQQLRVARNNQYQQMYPYTQTYPDSISPYSYQQKSHPSGVNYNPVTSSSVPSYYSDQQYPGRSYYSNFGPQQAYASSQPYSQQSYIPGNLQGYAQIQQTYPQRIPYPYTQQPVSSYSQLYPTIQSRYGYPQGYRMLPTGSTAFPHIPTEIIDVDTGPAFLEGKNSWYFSKYGLPPGYRIEPIPSNSGPAGYPQSRTHNKLSQGFYPKFEVTKSEVNQVKPIIAKPITKSTISSKPFRASVTRTISSNKNKEPVIQVTYEGDGLEEPDVKTESDALNNEITDISTTEESNDLITDDDPPAVDSWYSILKV